MIWEWIDRVSGILGILTLPFLGIFFSWLRKKVVSKRPLTLSGSTDKIGVLVVNVSRISINEEVKIYMRTSYPELQVNGGKRKKHIVDDPNHFHSINIPESITTSDLTKFRELLEDEEQALQEHGIGHIHLFIRAPMMIPVIIGDTFANNKRITFHQHNINTGTYECWGVI